MIKVTRPDAGLKAHRRRCAFLWAIVAWAAVGSRSYAQEPLPEKPSTNEAVPQSGEASAKEMREVNVTDTEVKDNYTVPDASTATKTDTPLMETPFSVQVVPHQVLVDQNARVLDQALSNVSGVTTVAEPGQEAITIRGFFTTATLWNGFRIDEYSTTGGGTIGDVLMDNTEKVEVLKGPAGILYGRVEPGGMINVITKQPLDHFYASAGAMVGSWRHELVALDVTGPVNESKTVLYRINAAEEYSDSWQWNANYRSLSLSPVLEWRLSPNTRVSLEGEFRQEVTNGAGSVVPVDPTSGDFVPVPMPYTPLQGGSTFDISRVYFHLDQRMGAQWSASLKLLHTESVVPVSLNTYLNQVYFPAVGPNNLTVDLNTSLTNSTNRTDAGMLDFVGHVSLFGTQHTLLLGGDYYHTPISFPSLGYSCCYTTNFYNPTPLTGADALAANGPNGFFFSGESNQSSRDYGIYFQDQVELPGRVHVLAGIRYQHYVETSNSSSAIGAPLTYNEPAEDHMFTPRFGILWRAQDWLSLYYSYSQNFGNNNGFAYPNIPLPPENARQNEVGAKTEFYGGRLTSTLALYNLTKYNVLAPDPEHVGYSIAIGEIRSRGYEYDLQGGLTPNWDIVANTSYVQPITLIGNNSYPAGQRTPGVAEHTFNLWTTYKLTAESLRGLKVGAGANWRSSTAPYYNPTPGGIPDLISTPAYWTGSAMVAYEKNFGTYKTTVQFNVNNAFNHSYYNGLYPVLPQNFTFVYYGSPREYRLSARVEF